MEQEWGHSHCDDSYCDVTVVIMGKPANSRNLVHCLIWIAHSIVNKFVAGNIVNIQLSNK